MDYSFLKALKATFLSLCHFINEVQEMGFIERSFLSYSIVPNLDEKVFRSPYYDSVKKLFENLEHILNLLESSSKTTNSDSMMPCNAEDTLTEEEIAQQYIEQNIHDESLSNFHCVRASKYQNSIQLDSGQDHSPQNSIEFDSGIAHSPQSPSAESFPKSDIYLPNDESSKEFNQLVAFQETPCISNSLVAPFENLALHTTNSSSRCEKQTISDVYSHPSLITPSSIFIPSVTSPCNIQAVYNPTVLSDLTSIPSTVNTFNTNKEVIMTSCTKASKTLPNNPLEEYRSDLNENSSGIQQPVPVSRKLRVKFPHPCLLCDRIFNTWRHLSIHMKKVHGDEETQECLPSVSDSSDNLERGSATPVLPLFCCKTCNSTSRTMTKFQSHLCRLPNEETQANPNLSNRILITSVRRLEEMKKFVCECCGVEFRSFKRVSYHLPRCSPGPYPCNMCASVFLTTKDLNYHKKKIHRGERCFTCDECSKSFVRKASLRKHCVNKHESNSLLDGADADVMMSYDCDLCPKKFIKKIFLTNHKFRVHGIYKTFLCHVCGKNFMTSCTFSLHLDTHNGEKKFKCVFCHRRFRRKEKWLHHQRIHIGERPFDCPRCSKAFVSKTRLNEHLRRHDAQRRFQCPRCDKTYASAWDLKKHMRKKHELQIPTQNVKVVLRKVGSAPILGGSKISDSASFGAPSMSRVIPTVDSTPISSAPLPFDNPLLTLVQAPLKDTHQQEWITPTLVSAGNPHEDFAESG